MIIAWSVGELTDAPIFFFLCAPPDENECKYRPCDVFAQCTNTLGSFTCTCYPGYEGDGFTCTGEFNYFKFLEKRPKKRFRFRFLFLSSFKRKEKSKKRQNFWCEKVCHWFARAFLVGQEVLFPPRPGSVLGFPLHWPVYLFSPLGTTPEYAALSPSIHWRGSHSRPS